MKQSKESKLLVKMMQIMAEYNRDAHSEAVKRGIRAAKARKELSKGK
jgi:DNA invertase Pin-like site-specific DNA recombinase